MSSLFLAIAGICMILLAKIIFALNKSNIFEWIIYTISKESDGELEKKEEFYDEY